MGKKFANSNRYEIMAAFYLALGHKGFEEEMKLVEEEITSLGGEIFLSNVWGKRDLMYRIGKETQAYYMVWNFTMEGSQIAKLKKELDLNQKLLRYLLVKLPDGYTSPKSFEPFFLNEEKGKEKLEKKEAEAATPAKKVVRRAPAKVKVEEEAEAAKPEVKEPVVKAEKHVKETVAPAAPAEEVAPKKSTRTTAKTKAAADPNFDQKLDEIIENLDNL